MPPPQTILIVDDEVHIRAVIAQKLIEAGYEVVTACDSAEALRLAAAHLPALIVTDKEGLGDNDGVAFCAALQTIPPLADTPVIMVTGRPHRLDSPAASPPNLKAVLSKPFSVRHLVRQVNLLLNPPASAAAPERERPAA